jgi:hypothetical protein
VPLKWHPPPKVNRAVSLGYDADGRRKRKTVYGPTKKEVQDKLRKLQTDYALGQMADPNGLTVDAYLTLWLENTARVKTSPTTYERYEQLVRLHVVPHVGHLKLEKVAPMHVHSLMGALQRAGESLWTQKMVGTLLHNAFRSAARLRLMVHNP